MNYTPNILNSDTLQTLCEIEEQHGVVTKEAIVKEASDPHSPLHNYFEWNKEQAARAYRRTQAQQLLELLGLPYRDDSSDETIEAS